MQGFASLFYLFHYIFLSNVRLEICSTLQQALEENIIKCLCKEVEKNLHLLIEKCLRTCIDKNFSLPHRIIINLAIGAFRFGENLSYTPKAKLHFFSQACESDYRAQQCADLAAKKYSHYLGGRFYSWIPDLGHIGTTSELFSLHIKDKKKSFSIDDILIV